MAQTGYTPIQLYRTTTAAATPLAANLNAGELAINYNTADMSVWALNTGGSVVRLMNNPAGLKYPTVDGTSNQVLKTDGAGLLSWVTAVLSGGALGTPTSGTLTNCTGLPISSGVFGLGTGVATFLATPSSANLAAALTDETGTAGKVVFDTNPIFPAQINLTANSGYNIYASGSANNYLAGRLSIGGTNFGGAYGDISCQRTITGATDTAAVGVIATIASDVTSSYTSFKSQPATQAASFTLSYLNHFTALQFTKGAGSTISTQAGFVADISLTNGVNNYGFYGGIASGTNRYNLYMAGTADNYLAGSLGIGALPYSGVDFLVAKPVTGGTVRVGASIEGAVQSSVTGLYIGQNVTFQTAAASFTCASAQLYRAFQSTLGAGSSVTSQVGFYADTSLTGAVNNFGFYGAINASAGTSRYNLYMAGTADNYLAGSLGIGTASPSASAILDAQSTTKGVRFPNMTTTQKNAVSSPAAGLVVFDTTSSKLCVYTGAAWQTITSV